MTPKLSLRGHDSGRSLPAGRQGNLNEFISSAFDLFAMIAPHTMKTKIVYSYKYYIDIGAHVFPTIKYKLIKKKLLEDLSIVNRITFVEPEIAREKDLLRVHTRAYLDKLKYGKLSFEEILTLELPYSKELVEGSMLCCGGTIRACENAIEDGLGIHLGAVYFRLLLLLQFYC